jgi:ABC-type branched-subunit amino acid transport system substrate-binding protein
MSISVARGHEWGRVAAVLIVTCVYCVSFVSCLDVHIGGIFAPISPLGVLDRAQQEHLAAFVMAINEINDKTDGMYDDLLNGTTIKFAAQQGPSMKTAATNFITLAESFDNQGLFGVVNSLPSLEGMYVIQLAVNLGIPNILSVTNNGALNEHATYPYMAKTVPLVSHQGVALQRLLCSYGPKTKFVLVVSLSEEDIAAYLEFAYAYIAQYYGGVCKNPALGVVSVLTDQTSMTTTARSVKATGGRYFVFLLPSYQAAALLEEGYKTGAFDEYSVILTTDRGINNITSQFTAEADVTSMMTGVFSLKYWANYYTNRTSAAKGFARRWREQPSRAGTAGVCDSTTDDDGNFYLYKATVNQTTVCTGLNFSAYDESGFDMQPYTALTYDATIMMATAVHKAIVNGTDYMNPLVIQDALVEIVMPDGASGPIQLSKGQPANQYDTLGERLTGIEYLVTNFNPSLYESGSADYFVTVAYYDAENMTIEACSSTDSDACYERTYGVATDGSTANPPASSPPTIVEHLDPAIKTIFRVMSWAIIGLSVVIAGLIVWYRNHRVMKASQPISLLCILVGALFAAARIIVGGIDKDRELCVAQFWTGHLAFVIMIGSLFVKSYRVHCIVNTRKLRRVTFSAMDAFLLLVAIVTTVVVYLAISTKFGVPNMRVLSETVSNQETVWKYCGMQRPQFQTALYACETVMMIIGFRTCWEIRNVPDIVNESKQISSAMSVIVLVSALLLPIVSFLNLPPFTIEFISALGFGFGAIVTLALLFAPKLIAIAHTRSNENRTGESRVAALTAHGGSTDEASTSVRQRRSKFIQDAEELLRHKSHGQRLEFCQEQLLGWQAMVLSVQGHMMYSSKDYTASRAPFTAGGARGVSSMRTVNFRENRPASDKVSSQSGDPSGIPLMGNVAPNDADSVRYFSMDDRNILDEGASKTLMVTSSREPNILQTMEQPRKEWEVLDA